MSAPISPRARVERLRSEARELRAFACVATNRNVHLMLDSEACEREEKALALEEWLNRQSSGATSTGDKAAAGSA
jgi:hypothetical protein